MMKVCANEVLSIFLILETCAKDEKYAKISNSYLIQN